MPVVDIHPNATEDVLPAFPAPLAIVQPPPTAAAIYAAIPPAVIYNLYRIINDGVRYEHNLYGYLDAAFNAVFPVDRGYQTNPQYPGRPDVVVGQLPHGQNVSIGSMGEIYAARGNPRDVGMRYPDFVFSKPRPSAEPTPRVNRPFGVAEIKISKDAEQEIRNKWKVVTDALDQIFDSCEQFSHPAHALLPPGSGIIPSYCVYGKYYTKAILVPRNGGLVFEAEPWQFVFEVFNLPVHAPLLYRLCELASDHWND